MENDNINTQEYWDGVYSESFYHENFAIHNDLTRKHIAETLNGRKGLHILEIGCGNGRDAFFTASLGHKVDAMDISRTVIEKIVSMRDGKNDALNSNPFFMCSDIDSYILNCGTDFYDVIMCFEVLEHFRDPLKRLRKIAKLLKTEGCLIFSVPREGGRLDVWHEHYYHFTYGRCIDMLTTAGFRNVRFRMFPEVINDRILGVAYR